MGLSWRDSGGYDKLERKRYRGVVHHDLGCWYQFLVPVAFGLCVLMWLILGPVLTTRAIAPVLATFGVMVMTIGFIGYADATSDQPYLDNLEARKYMLIIFGGFALVVFGGVFPFFFIPILAPILFNR